jgi:histidinol dehydrogenase
LVAADLAAQAEHDPLAKPLLLTTSESLAQAVNKELEQELGMGSLSAAAAECLQRQAAAILCQDLQEALALANEFAPEHLCLSVRDPWPLLPFVRHAGGVFLGEHMCESLGDYIAGPSHVMPTGGTARFSSPLSVWDFVKICSVFALGPEEARSLGSAAATLAALEGLQAHRRAILLRAGG